MIINHFLSLICQIGVEHKIYIFLYKLEDLVRTEHTFFGFVCQPRELQPAFVSTNKLDTVECFPQAANHYYLMLALERGVLKHVLHRYTDEHYFHPRVLVYSALILLPIRWCFSSAMRFRKRRGTKTHGLSLSRHYRIILSTEISIQHYIIVFKHETLNIVRKIL